MDDPHHGAETMALELQSKTLRERDAAKYLGMSRSWLAQARMHGNPEGPPFIKIGRAVRYLREDLDRWLEGRRRTSTSSRAINLNL